MADPSWLRPTAGAAVLAAAVVAAALATWRLRRRLGAIEAALAVGCTATGTLVAGALAADAAGLRLTWASAAAAVAALAAAGLGALPLMRRARAAGPDGPGLRVGPGLPAGSDSAHRVSWRGAPALVAALVLVAASVGWSYHTDRRSLATQDVELALVGVDPPTVTVTNPTSRPVTARLQVSGGAALSLPVRLGPHQTQVQRIGSGDGPLDIELDVTAPAGRVQVRRLHVAASPGGPTLHGFRS